MLLKNQGYITASRGMPVETLDDSQRVEDISGETVQLNYNNAGVLTADAGEAAGTFVVGKLAQGAVLNALGDMGGSENDTSLSFTSTALTNEVAIPDGFDNYDRNDITERFGYIASKLTTNGDYCVDYVHGVIYGLKADASTTLTNTAYKIPVRGGSSSLILGSVTADITKVNGTTVNEGGVSGSLGVGGNVAHDSADAGNPLKVGAVAKSSQQTAVDDGDRTDLVANLNGELVVAGYNWTTQANRISEVSPINTAHVEETLIDATMAAATTYYYVDMDGFKNFGAQLELTGTITVTLEATIQDDGTAPSSCVYQDVTNDLFSVASATADDMWLSDTNIAFKYIRYKVDATGGGGTATCAIYHKKMY